MAGGETHLRGKIAPASLKLCILPTSLHPHWYLRGKIAPASLKRQRNVESFMFLQHISGAKSPRPH